MNRKQLLEAFKNRSAIWEGLKNNLIKSDHIEALCEERLEVCMSCEFYKTKGPNECAIPGTGPCCPECGCSLYIKGKSPAASCPHEFWKAVMTEQEENLLNVNLNDQDHGRRDRTEDSKSNLQDSDGASERQ